MRVLFWCPHVNPGGGERLLSRLAPAVSRQPGVELVRLVVPEDVAQRFATHQAASPHLEIHGLQRPQSPRGLRAWLQRDERVFGIPGTRHLRYKLRKAVVADPLLAMQQMLHQELQRLSRDCDLVYVFWPHLQEFPDLDRPVVCTFQDATVLEYPEIGRGTLVRQEWARSETWLRRSARVVVSSKATRVALVRLFGEAHESAAVVHHAIVPAHEKDLAASAQPRPGLPKAYVVYPGNTTIHKNHYNLLLAWSRFSRRKDFPLVMFGGETEVLNVTPPDWGKDWQHCRLAGVVARTGLRKNEDFYALGFVPDSEVMGILRNASALIMPSLVEGGGSYPVEEALSVGVPVLCSDIPVMREHLGGRTAKIGWFDPECPADIVRAADALFDDYDEYKRASLSAVNDPRPTWDDVAAGYVAVFCEALE